MLFRSAKALTDLLKKDKKFVWSAEAEESFKTLKDKLTSAPVIWICRIEDMIFPSFIMEMAKLLLV